MIVGGKHWPLNRPQCYWSFKKPWDSYLSKTTEGTVTKVWLTLTIAWLIGLATCTGQNGELIILAKRANAGFYILDCFRPDCQKYWGFSSIFLLLEDTSVEKYDDQQETGNCWDLLRYKVVSRDTVRAIKLRSGSWKADICKSQRNHNWGGRTVYMFCPQSIGNGDSLCD